MKERLLLLCVAHAAARQSPHCYVFLESSATGYLSMPCQVATPVSKSHGWIKRPGLHTQWSYQLSPKPVVRSARRHNFFLHPWTELKAVRTLCTVSLLMSSSNLRLYKPSHRSASSTSTGIRTMGLWRRVTSSDHVLWICWWDWRRWTTSSALGFSWRWRWKCMGQSLHWGVGYYFKHIRFWANHCAIHQKGKISTSRSPD